MEKIAYCLAAFLVYGCASNDLGNIAIDCSQSTLDIAIVSTSDPSGCSASDGSLVVEAIGGESPYVFFLDTESNSTGSFDGLTLGNYVIKITDSNLCERFLNVFFEAEGATLGLELVVTEDTECVNGNGMIVANGIGGIEPYEYSINQGAFGPSPTFAGLSAGEYVVELKDSEGCLFSSSAAVFKGITGVSFAGEIQPIIDTKCALTGCHNGDNGAERNWTIFSNVKTNASNIKTKTGDRSMPLTGSLTQDQIDLIACWVDEGAQNN
jgi:hypothetical protein